MYIYPINIYLYKIYKTDLHWTTRRLKHPPSRLNLREIYSWLISFRLGILNNIILRGYFYFLVNYKRTFVWLRYTRSIPNGRLLASLFIISQLVIWRCIHITYYVYDSCIWYVYVYDSFFSLHFCYTFCFNACPNYI